LRRIYIPIPRFPTLFLPFRTHALAFPSHSFTDNVLSYIHKHISFTLFTPDSSNLSALRTQVAICSATMVSARLLTTCAVVLKTASTLTLPPVNIKSLSSRGQTLPDGSYLLDKQFIPNSQIPPNVESFPNGLLSVSGQPIGRFFNGRFEPYGKFLPNGDFVLFGQSRPIGHVFPNGQFLLNGQSQPVGQFLPNGQPVLIGPFGLPTLPENGGEPGTPQIPRPPPLIAVDPPFFPPPPSDQTSPSGQPTIPLPLNGHGPAPVQIPPNPPKPSGQGPFIPFIPIIQPPRPATPTVADLDPPFILPLPEQTIVPGQPDLSLGITPYQSIVISNIESLTKRSQALQEPARSISFANGVLFAAGRGPFSV
jgi:hypothetical protein